MEKDEKELEVKILEGLKQLQKLRDVFNLEDSIIVSLKPQIVNLARETLIAYEVLEEIGKVYDREIITGTVTYPFNIITTRTIVTNRDRPITDRISFISISFGYSCYNSD
jgi:hypothetical protein